MEKVILTKAEFDSMSDYSMSLPTGTSYGKVWRAERRDGWIMGEYVPDPKAKIGKDGKPETVLINWRIIEVKDEIPNTQPATP